MRLQTYPAHAVTWEEPFPPEVRDGVEPILNACLFMVPGWAEAFYASYRHSPQDDLACVLVNVEYRRFTLRIHSGFLDLPPKGRALTLIHELAHAILGPYAENVGSVVKAFVQEQPVKDYVEEQIRAGMEASTEDLAHALLRLVSDPENVQRFLSLLPGESTE